MGKKPDPLAGPLEKALSVALPEVLKVLEATNMILYAVFGLTPPEGISPCPPTRGRKPRTGSDSTY
jgi:hypothetical protein